MTDTKELPILKDILEDLDITISQVSIYNLYVDSDSDDSHLSTCLEGLKKSLTSISHRLNEYQNLSEVKPPVKLEVVTND